jgi:hypothetical protein
MPAVVVLARFDLAPGRGLTSLGCRQELTIEHLEANAARQNLEPLGFSFVMTSSGI